MRNEQDSKPDFLRDLSAEIIEEMTGGWIKDSAAGLAGEIKEVEEVTELCGLRFNGYLAKIETPRRNRTTDEVMVAFAGGAADIGQQRGKRHIKEYFTAGSKAVVSGKVQTLKDFKSGKVLVFILADFIALASNPMMQDDVAMRGIIAYDPVYRKTPRGKRITDIIVIVRNDLTGGKCFIPCICWQEQADEAAGWKRGDMVELLGRYQSRQYNKKVMHENGDSGEGRTDYEISTRTVYEISIQMINRKERAGE